MKHLFNNIEQTEKDRILEMHKSATKNHYLMTEQGKNVHPADKAKAEELKKRKEEKLEKKKKKRKGKKRKKKIFLKIIKIKL
jgi:hypothetical protein